MRAMVTAVFFNDVRANRVSECVVVIVVVAPGFCVAFVFLVVVFVCLIVVCVVRMFAV